MVPSPKLMDVLAMVPSGSLEPAVEAVTASGTVPLVGVTESLATGYSFAGATVSESALVAVTGVGAESLAAKVGLKDPEAVGVPEIAPVLALRLTPAGNAPAEIDHVYGVTPPLACSVAL